MTVSSDRQADAQASWISSLSLCCAPLASFLPSKPGRRKSTSLSNISWPVGRTSDEELLMGQDGEKAPFDTSINNNNNTTTTTTTITAQPIPEPHPVASNGSSHHPSSSRDKASRKSLSSMRTTLSLKRRLRSDGSSRRPLISGPSNFRHVRSGSFHFPQQQFQSPQPRDPPTNRRCSLRPLELSIYVPGNRLSPILPHFDMNDLVPPPPAAYIQTSSDGPYEDMHQRSYSTMSFHVPRRLGADSPPSTSFEGSPAPEIPPKAPGRNRARAYTSPEMDALKERVASAMIEVEKLQMQIDDVIDRQSNYTPSRPSTAHSIARTMPELEPMPSIPALPPAAPSFAERLNKDASRPQTAPIKSPLRIPHRSKTFNEASSAFDESKSTRSDDILPPPPLPLVLRPPLRKKKSFSRVSTWLFPGQQHHQRDVSLESITNLPRPVKGTEGFYQCLPGEGTPKRGSFDSVGTVSTWETDEEERTVPTTWSPGSTPITKRDDAPLERTTTFGQTSESTVRTSVGVAV